MERALTLSTSWFLLSGALIVISTIFFGTEVLESPLIALHVALLGVFGGILVGGTPTRIHPLEITGMVLLGLLFSFLVGRAWVPELAFWLGWIALLGVGLGRIYYWQGRCAEEGGSG